ncbi:glycosyltransferase [Cellulosimicrobium protaetiae]|uniref:Glycosyltransferase n=1 Tax=Cellulosimicrobium protaetiae TaxID=2587808 RepID=A0A6M5UCN0_9MICO|nr:glycosyltransferase [Cellulosimicrobium protaetiae]QJW35980.1 glycosyltransferase [Cellulosimicrobium protaetiae]
MSGNEAAVPELSVIVPAYDAAGTIEVQLGALLEQRPEHPWEVLVCDNGSTDGTPDLVRRWGRRMPELRLVDASAVRGPGAARNAGAAVARSSRLAFCDADDRVGPGWVAGMRRALDAHDVVAGRFETVPTPRHRVAVTWSPQEHGLTTLDFLPGFVTAGAGNLGVRSAAFRSVGGFDETAATREDDDLCLRLQIAGYRLAFDPALVLRVRRREGVLAVYRQAYAYGVGSRWLEYRYALVARSLVRSTAEVPRGDGIVTTRQGSVSTSPARRAAAARALRKVARLWNPADIADVVWRAGWSRGRRVVPPATMPQVAPPDRSVDGRDPA